MIFKNLFGSLLGTNQINESIEKLRKQVAGEPIEVPVQPTLKDKFKKTLIPKSFKDIKMEIEPQLKLKDVSKQLKSIKATGIGTDQLFDATVVNQYATAIQGVNEAEAVSLLQKQGLSTVQQKQVMNQAALLASNKSLNASLVEETILNSTLSGQQAQEVLTELGLIDAKTQEVITTKQVTAAEVERILATKGIVGEQAKAIMATLTQSGANVTATGTTKGFTAAIYGNLTAIKAWMASNPLGWIMLLVGGIITAVSLFDKFTKSTKELKEEMEEYQNTAKEAESALESITSQLEEHEKQIDSLLKKDKLTYAEKGQLEELKYITKELLLQQDIEAKRAEEASKDAAQTAAKTYEKEYGGLDRYTATQGEVETKGSKSFLQNIASYQHYAKVIEESSALLEEAKATGNEGDIAWHEETIAAAKSAQGYILSLINDSEYQSGLVDQLGELFDLKSVMEGEYQRVREKQKDGYALTAPEQEVISAYKEIEDHMRLIYQYTNPNDWNGIQIADILNTKDVQAIYDSLLGMAQSGTLTPETIEGYSWLNEMLKEGNLILEDGQTAAEAFCEEIYAMAEVASKASEGIDEVLTNVERLENVQSLSSGFDMLNNIYVDVFDGGKFDYSSILNNDEFKEAFGGYEEEYNNFIETVANSPDDIGACQSAFNDLATAYIQDTGALEEVTEATKVATIAMLQQMGVANAEEIVMKQLAVNTITLADAQNNLNELKEAGVDTSVDLQNATAEEIFGLIREAELLDLDTTALHQYLTQKLRAKQIQLTTDGDIQGLANLCKSLGIASDVIIKYNSLKNQAFTKDNVKTGHAPNHNFKQVATALIFDEGTVGMSEEDLMQQMEDAILDFVNGEYKVDLEFDGGEAAENAKETFDWIETKISRLQRLITNLGKTISATWKSFGTRKNALSEQTDRIREEIQTQTNARDAYKKKADSVDLSEADKKLVREGAIKIDEITDETRKEKIQEYQEWYDKYLSADDAIADAEEELAGTIQQEFDLIASEYEGKLSGIEHEINEIDAAIEAAENRGLIVGSSFYDSLQQKEIEKRNLLQNQLKDMEAKLANPEEYGIVENSEEWYNLKSQIWETEEAIREAENAIIDYGNSARQADWDIFDKQQEKISQLYSETEFLMDLLDNDDLFDKDNGSMTERGEAAFGLHAINYQAYLEQAEDYAEELAEIEKEIAEEGESTDLLERKQELIEAQRESILNAEAEKEAIHGLYEEYYNNLLDVLQEIIDKRKEELQVTKDLYDYERSISEKTKTVSSYQKQLEAFSADDSEETQAKVQQIKLQLEQAKQDLQDTEYERYLSDQEQMLDSLVDDTQEWVNERLDNIDGLLKEAIEKTEAGATEISDTLKEIAGGFGINLSDELDTILGTGNVDTEQEKQVPVMKNVVKVLEDIKSLVDKLVVEDNPGGVNLHGYAKGSRRIPRNEFAWTQENGTELIYRSSDGAMLTPLGQGDAVFTSAMTQRLWDIAQNPNIFGGLTTTAMPMGLVNNGATNDIRNDVEFNITMYGVNNPAEFAKQLQFAIKTDKPVQKTIQDVTIGAAMGRNSLTRFTR